MTEPGGAEHAGGCACGQLRFSARGRPVRIGLCHCMTCRKASGSAFNAFVIYPRDRVALSGEALEWPSSDKGRRSFCHRCGGQVYTRDEGSAEIELRLGAFDEPNLFAPTYEAWVGRRESWLRTEHLAAYEGNRPEPPPGGPL